MSEELEADVVVVGGGAGGLATAITAAHQGLSVVLLDRDQRIGGATGRSGGWMWTPRSDFAQADGVHESIEDIETYLKSVVGEDFDAARTRAFLEAAPGMVRFFENETDLQFTPGAKINDIYGNNPHAGTGHRSVGPKPFNGRRLPRRLRKKMHGQFYMTSFVGMGIMAGPDLQGFLGAAQRNPKGFWHATKRVAQYVFDVVTGFEGKHYVNGIALIGRMLLSADKLGVDVRVRHHVTELVQDASGRVTGVVAKTPRGEVRIGARKGVVLASGGFSADASMRQAHFPHNTKSTDHYTLATDAADGTGIRLGESVGGVFSAEGEAAGAWCPVSLVPFRSGKIGVYPHIMDRAKPGSIGVRRDGTRFVNEANGYWDYVHALNAATPEGEKVESWQIGDHRALRRYSIGFAKPWPLPLTSYLRSGYLKRANSIRELAQQCGIDPDGLEKTVREFNENARRGNDPEFGRGSTPFNRYGGDPKVEPNPSLAPIENGPFYAVRVVQGTFGTFAGLRADEKARLVDASGKPVPGVYVVGVDQKNIFGGHYPAGGINIGPAMVFGYLAGRDLAGNPVTGDTVLAPEAVTV